MYFLGGMFASAVGDATRGAGGGASGCAGGGGGGGLADSSGSEARMCERALMAASCRLSNDVGLWRVGRGFRDRADKPVSHARHWPGQMRSADHATTRLAHVAIRSMVYLALGGREELGRGMGRGKDLRGTHARSPVVMLICRLPYTSWQTKRAFRDPSASASRSASLTSIQACEPTPLSHAQVCTARVDAEKSHSASLPLYHQHHQPS